MGCVTACRINGYYVSISLRDVKKLVRANAENVHSNQIWPPSTWYMCYFHYFAHSFTQIWVCAGEMQESHI